MVWLKILTSLHLVDIGLKFADVEMNWKGFCSGKGCSGKEVDLAGTKFCKLHQEPEHTPAVTLGHTWAGGNRSGTVGTENKQQKTPRRVRKTMTSVNWGVSVGEAASSGVTFYRKQEQAAGLGLARQSWATQHSVLTLCWTSRLKSVLWGACAARPLDCRLGMWVCAITDGGGKYSRENPGALSKGMF